MSLENIEKYITLVEQDLSNLSPRQRTAKMKAGQAPYLDSLMCAGVCVDFVEYLCGTLDETHKQCQARRRQNRFQLAKRKGHFNKVFIHCRVCGARLMRVIHGKLVETQTSFKHRAFCRGGECKKKLIATKPVHRVVKFIGEKPQLMLRATPIEHRDLLSDKLTANREGVKRLRKRGPKKQTMRHAKRVPKATDRLPVTIGDGFRILPGNVSDKVTQPVIPPVQRTLLSDKLAREFSFGKLEAEDIRE